MKNRAIALELDGRLYVPIHNQSGHPSVLVTSNKACAEGYTYTAFGQEQRYGTATSNPWHFSGKHVDPESGLAYFGEYYYNP